MRQKLIACHAILILAAVFSITAVGQVGNNEHVLNPNRASVDEMAALPHLTESIAQQIVENRMYLDMLSLDSFLSDLLSDEQRAELYPHLFVPINLNTASKEEILLVPGVGDRMAYEFDEYRPYVAIAQFRRQIGKYVDDDELARLEQFVFVPINLNEASDEDILSIPGIGARMLREFREYRPYKDIQQFRREMGKYVSEEEVARMERYVTLD